MATPQPGRPQQGTGLPPGVEVGPLGRRLVGYLVDSLVPGVLGALLVLALPGLSGTARAVLTVIFVAVIIGWLLLVWRMIATRAASPGMRLTKLQVVGFYDGRPIGWSRTFLRGLVLALLSVTGVGLILLLVFMLPHPRRQGWHDLVAKAVVIEERGLPPARVPGVGNASVAAGVDPGPEQPRVSAEPAPEVPIAPPAREVPEVTTAPPAWVAELDDGREVLVEGLVLLGRNPQPQPGEEEAQLIKLADETRTVSKSHLAIGLDHAGLFVVDRGSTNGSTVTTPAGVSTRLRAGEIAYVEEGSVVSVGDHWLRIQRPAS